MLPPVPLLETINETEVILPNSFIVEFVKLKPDDLIFFRVVCTPLEGLADSNEVASAPVFVQVGSPVLTAHLLLVNVEVTVTSSANAKLPPR